MVALFEETSVNMGNCIQLKLYLLTLQDLQTPRSFVQLVNQVALARCLGMLVAPPILPPVLGEINKLQGRMIWCDTQMYILHAA